jgi:uncharacterized protein YbcI
VVGGGGTGYWGRVRVVVGEGLLEREGAGDLVSNTYIVVQEHKLTPTEYTIDGNNKHLLVLAAVRIQRNELRE